MVTRRSTHANHARPSSAPKRNANRRASSHNGTLYAGGKSNGAQGGHVGNVAGYGSALPSSGNRRSSSPNIGNVAGLGSSSNISSGSLRGASVHGAGRHASGSKRASVQAPTSRSQRGGVGIPTPNGGEVLLTRRHFLFGALGIGALAAIGGGASVVANQIEKNNADDLVVLEVPTSSVATVNSLSLVDDYATRMNLAGSFELPFGSLVWANDDNVAACLIPTEGASPLSQAALLNLASGTYATALEGAVGLDEGFEIYDVRATSSGLIWTEADILDGVWRIYTARLNGLELAAPVLAEEGNSDWETPSIAAVGNQAFWQVLPKIGGSKAAENSVLKRVAMGQRESEAIYSSNGRMATPPYALDDSVVITPRADASSTNYQLTRIDANSGSVQDTLVLPTSMKPLEAGYGETGFTFSFEAGYSYGTGIDSIGTYVPSSAVSDGNYSAASWFCFDRAPTAPPAWCGKYFMVKSTSAVCGIDLASNEYFAFDVENGADTYGEYLASTGSRDTVVTYANVDHKPLDGDPVKCCRVRIWTPLA